MALNPLAEPVEVPFPLDLALELEKSAQSSPAGVLPEGLVDDLGFGLSMGHLHGTHDRCFFDIQGRSHHLPPDADYELTRSALQS